MKHLILTFAATLIGLMAHAEAKTDISVQKFNDKTEKGRCPVDRKVKAQLDKELQARLIAGLMELQRFQIQEREVRKIKPEHSIVGTVRTFEVCAGEGKGQKVELELQVQLLSKNGDLTHMFSSSAQTTSAAANRAPEIAMNTAIGEIIKRIDDAVPRRAGTIRLTSKRKISSSSPLMVKLIPKERR